MDCGGKEQGFAEENTTGIAAEVQSCYRVEILFCKFTNEAGAKVPTLSFLEQADTFAVGEQEDKRIKKEVWLASRTDLYLSLFCSASVFLNTAAFKC